MTHAAQGNSRHRRLRNVLLATVALCVVGLVVAFSAGRVDGLHGGTPRLDARLGWRVGEERSYKSDLSSRVTAANQAVLDVRVSGTWRLTRIGPDAARTGDRRDPAALPLELAAQFEADKLSFQTAPEQEAAVKRALGERIVVQFSSRGSARKIGFSHADDPAPERDVARGILRTLVATLQFTAAPSRDAQTWTARELDAIGVYDAQYRRIDATSAERAKLRYDQVSARNAFDATTTIERSRARAEFAGSELALASLLNVGFDEGTRVKSSGPLPELAATQTVRLSFQASSQVAPALLSELTKQLGTVTLVGLNDRSLEGRQALDRSRVSGPNLADIIGGLAQLERAPKPDPAQHAKLFAALSAKLRFEPGAIATAMRLIHDGSPLRAAVIDALADAGTADAQRALRGLFDESSSSADDRYRILLGLSLGKSPAPETVAFLEEHEQGDWHQQARYGLGSAAFYLREQDPEAASDVVAHLTNELHEAANVTDKVQLLKALGNAAHPDSLDTLKPYLADERPGVRAAAIEALRRIPGREADAYLARTLLTDSTTQARLASLHAMTFRDASPALVYAVRDCLSRESDVAVRRAAAKAALRWARDAPILRTALSVVAQNDSDRRVREIAATVL